MNILSRIPSPLSVDGAYVWFQVLSLLFLTATILTGAGTIITGFISNRRTTLALSAQQERTAKAEKELEETKTRITSVVEAHVPQWAKLIMHAKSGERVLESGPKGTVDIVYRRDSANGFRLGTNIGMSLSSAGWTLLSAEQNTDPLRKLEPRAVPSVMELLPDLAKRNWSDMVVLSREHPQSLSGPPATPAVALWSFLMSSDIPAYITADPSLPEGTVRLVITVP
jgi:hypothetical protein